MTIAIWFYERMEYRVRQQNSLLEIEKRAALGSTSQCSPVLPSNIFPVGHSAAAQSTRERTPADRNYLRLRASLIVDAAKRRNREMPQNREVIKGSLNNTPLRPSVLLFTPPSLQED